MAKKGATRSGGSAARQRGKDQEMAARLPPSPVTWRRNAWDWPYHNNLGTRHVRIGCTRTTSSSES